MAYDLLVNPITPILLTLGGSVAVHFIDLDRFKEVDDMLGHEGGGPST